MGPKVSIVIPLFNSERYVSRTIESAIAQTWQNKEIIIVDDGSTDNSLKIAQGYSGAGIKIFSGNNAGASSARNRGFSAAQGDYILAPEKIEMQVRRLSGESHNSVSSGPFYNFIDDIRSGIIRPDAGFSDFSNALEWLILAANGEAMFPPLVWLVPRSLFEAAGLWNENLSYNDDSEFFARVLIHAEGICYCEHAVSYYRRGNPQSLGSRADHKARLSEFQSLQLVISHMLLCEDSFRVREACATRLRKMIYSLYPDHPEILSDAEAELAKLNIDGKYLFGKGLTSILGRVIGWKNAKKLQRYYKRK